MLFGLCLWCCLVFVGTCRYINMMFLLNDISLGSLFCLTCCQSLCWKKANLKMSKVSTCQVFPKLCLLHMKGCEMLLQKGVVIHAFVCVLYKTTSLSLRISAVLCLILVFFLTVQVMYIQVEVYHGISPSTRNETGRFLQIQRLKRHVQNVQNVRRDVSDKKSHKASMSMCASESSSRLSRVSRPKMVPVGKETKTYTLVSIAPENGGFQ